MVRFVVGCCPVALRDGWRGLISKHEVKFVSLHPYFKVHPGKLEAIKALLPRFVEKTATEKAVLFYAFTMNGFEFFCREAYDNCRRAARASGQCLRAASEGDEGRRFDPNRSAWAGERVG